MGVAVHRFSRLRFCALVEESDGTTYFDLPEYPDIPSRTDDLVHVTADGDTLPLIALRYYDDTVLWWVIALVNDLDLPTQDLVPGIELRVPSPRFVLSDLLPRAR